MAESMLWLVVIVEGRASSRSGTEWGCQWALGGRVVETRERGDLPLSSPRLRVQPEQLTNLRRRVTGHEATDERCGLTTGVPLKVGQGLLGSFTAALGFEQKNGQGAEQGEIACGGGVAHGATILVLGAIAAVVLAVFDGPVTADQIEQSLRSGLFGPEAGEGESHVLGFLDHSPAPASTRKRAFCANKCRRCASWRADHWSQRSRGLRCSTAELNTNNATH
jgi:hypothetical protein